MYCQIFPTQKWNYQTNLNKKNKKKLEIIRKKIE